MSIDITNTCPWCGAKGRRVEGIKPGAACSDPECPLYSKWFFVEQWEGRKENELEKHLKELMEQWQETVNIISVLDGRGAAAYRECMEELSKILSGNLSPIERL